MHIQQLMSFVSNTTTLRQVNKLAFKATQNQSNGPKQALVEPDVYRGRLVQAITLGLQAQKDFQGKAKPPVAEIMLTWELCDEFMKDEDGNDLEDKPRWIHETMPFYPPKADKAKSAQRMKALDPTDQFDGDISKMVDIPVNVTIVHNVKGDKTYVNVGNVAAMAAKKAATCPELKNPIKLFDIDEPDAAIYKSLPEWIQKKMQENLNYKGSALEAIVGSKAAPAKKAEAAEPADEEAENPY